MYKLQQATTKFKGWVKDYKGTIIVTSIAITSGVLIGTLIGTVRDDELMYETDSQPIIGFGRELEMRFIDTKTGKIVGRGGCYEVYMDAVLDIVPGI